MALAVSIPEQTSTHLLGQLGQVCEGRGLGDLAGRLADLDRWVRNELRDVEAALATVSRGPRAVQQAAHHLLDLGGKHLRPMCVVLASKVGTGFGPAARELGLAVELVHSATLLHDDVVDLAATRRGEIAARTVYGNAASIFAGDWLLVEALRRIRGARVPGLLDAMLDVIEEMILAESLQLERRGKIRGDIADYFRVAEGKTAALFAWAMRAGARAGGLSAEAEGALARFGTELGVAFQLVDDCLDFEGDVAITGKGLFADLREGKLTYPVLVALEREPAVEAVLQEAVASELPSAAVCAEITAALRRTGGLADGRRLARARVDAAVGALAILPASAAREALITVAEATVLREA